MITRKKQRTITRRIGSMRRPDLLVELGVVESHDFGLHLLVHSVQHFQQLRRSRVGVPIGDRRCASHKQLSDLARHQL